MSQLPEPQASRPHMPKYGIPETAEGPKLLKECCLGPGWSNDYKRRAITGSRPRDQMGARM